MSDRKTDHKLRWLKRGSDTVLQELVSSQWSDVPISDQVTNYDLFGASDHVESKQNNMQDDYICTSKKKKITGKDKENFEKFWDAFAYKENRAEAAQSWIDITDEKTPEFIDLVVFAAKKTASARKPGKSHKMAQGWITARRWENYQEAFNNRDKVGDKWGPLRVAESDNEFSKNHWRNNWQSSWGNNPWYNYNSDIPSDIRNKFAKDWGWK